MPQPKKPSSSSRRSSGARRRASSSARARKPSPPAPPEEATLLAQGVGALRESVARVADALNVVMVPRDRLQAVMDDAVARGHLTRQAANDLVAELVRRGRRELEDAFVDADQLMGRMRGAPGADIAAQGVERARRAVGTGSALPIAGYDDLTAAQVGARLEGLSPAELRRIRDYERRHGNRKSVLAAVERALG